MIGVLGGMGPMATVDFFSKVIAATPATQDENHVPLLIQSDPRVPCRPHAILQGGKSPLPALLAGRGRLIAAGAIALAMPCNTAHFWFAELLEDCPVPFLSIVDATCDEAAASTAPGAGIGLIATGATLTVNLFDKRLQSMGFVPMLPQDAEMMKLVLPAIALVKAGRAREGGELVEQAVQALLNRGATTVVLDCTETPLALDAAESKLRNVCVDSTGALARACVRWWHSREESRQGMPP
ncbi:MAG: aspartate/glutamate racemase family protein [Rhodoferax sp.]|nr:aspartate/glutamate racemase family protein [Rhodoferax sp.]